MEMFVFIFARIFPICFFGSLLAYRWYWRIRSVKEVDICIVDEKIIWSDVKGWRLVKFILQYNDNHQIHTTESLECKVFLRTKSNWISRRIKGKLCENGRVSCNHMYFYELVSLFLLVACFI